MTEKFFLNQNETFLLEELDRFIDAFFDAQDQHPPEIVLSHKQMNVLRRVLDKATAKPEYDFSMKFDLLKNTYRGIPLIELPKNRRYRRRKDMIEINFTKDDD